MLSVVGRNTKKKQRGLTPQVTGAAREYVPLLSGPGGEGSGEGRTFHPRGRVHRPPGGVENTLYNTLIFISMCIISLQSCFFFFFPPNVSSTPIEVHYALAKIEATAVGEGRMVKTSDGSFTVADIWWGQEQKI